MEPSVFAAARRGSRAEFIRVLDEEGIKGDQVASLRDESGHSLLHWASLDGFTEIADEILARDPSAVNALSTASTQLDQTPLHWAAVGGRHAVARLLVTHGADVNHRDAKGYTAIHHAAHYGHVATAHLLVKLGADPDDRDQGGRSPLVWAAYQGHLGFLVYLLRLCQADVRARDGEGRTALHRAAQAGNYVEVVALLGHGADPTSRDNQDLTAKVLASGRKATRTIRALDRPPSFSRFSPNRMAVVYFYYIVLALSLWVYISTLSTTFNASPVLHASFILMSLTSLYMHSRTTYMDPGFIPCRSVSYFKQVLDAIIGDADRQILFDFGASGIVDELSRDDYCFTCFCPRELGSHHCFTCNRCCREFDHHCPWVNNCIGARNHRHLLLMSILILTAEILFTVLGIKALQLFMYRSEGGWSLALVELPQVSVLLVVHAAVTIFVIVLIATQATIIARGSTTHAQIRRIQEARRSGENPSTLQSILALGPANPRHCLSFVKGERYSSVREYPRLV